MLEFQSNVFHYHYHLPPPPPMSHDLLYFCFVVDDDPTTLVEVAIGSSYSIDELKSAIVEKLLLEVPTSQIILWKVRSCYNRSPFGELIRLIARDANSSYP